MAADADFLRVSLRILRSDPLNQELLEYLESGLANRTAEIIRLLRDGVRRESRGGRFRKESNLSDSHGVEGRQQLPGEDQQQEVVAADVDVEQEGIVDDRDDHFLQENTAQEHRVRVKSEQDKKPKQQVAKVHSGGYF